MRNSSYQDKELMSSEESLARLNTPIDQTIKSVVKKYKTKNFRPDLVVVVNVVCPFLNSNNFESAINLLKIFNTDEVIAVKKENDNFFHLSLKMQLFQLQTKVKEPIK